MLPEYKNMNLIEKRAAWMEKYKEWKLKANEVLLLADKPNKDDDLLRKIINKIQKLKNSAVLLKAELEEINREEKNQKKLT